MAKLATSDFDGRDATYDKRVPVKDGVIVKAGQFITMQNTAGVDEIVLATDAPTGLALTGTTGSTANKCSIVYIDIDDGDSFLIPPDVAGTAFKAGYYILKDADTIDTGSFSATPIAGKINFKWNGRTFAAHTF